MVTQKRVASMRQRKRFVDWVCRAQLKREHIIEEQKPMYNKIAKMQSDNLVILTTC